MITRTSSIKGPVGCLEVTDSFKPYHETDTSITGDAACFSLEELVPYNLLIPQVPFVLRVVTKGYLQGGAHEITVLCLFS